MPSERNVPKTTIIVKSENMCYVKYGATCVNFNRTVVGSREVALQGVAKK